MEGRKERGREGERKGGSKEGQQNIFIVNNYTYMYMYTVHV